MKFVAGAFMVGILANSDTGLREQPVFVASAFARLQAESPELEKRFAWPAAARFEATHRQFGNATPIHMIGGHVTVIEGGNEHRRRVILAVDTSPRGGLLRAYAETTSGVYETANGLLRLPGQHWATSGTKPFSHTGEGVTVKFVPSGVTSAPSVDAAAWADWTYATTLLALPTSVYVEGPRGHDRWGANQNRRDQRERQHLTRIERAIDEGKADVAASAIATAVATSVDDTGVWGADGWGKVAEWSERRGDLDNAIGIRARYQPVGRCSMDRAPQAAAVAYADLCFAAGRLGCFLDLQVQVMGDQFARVTYSSYGEAANDTRAERLRNIGIDAARFMRGLVFRYAVPGTQRRELDPWRLARSMKEAGLGAEMLIFLKNSAVTPALDTFNRMRAAETYAYLRFHNETPRKRFDLDERVRRALVDDIRADLVGFNLPEPAASWAKSFGEGD